MDPEADTEDPASADLAASEVASRAAIPLGNGLPPCGSGCDFHDPSNTKVWINHNDPMGFYFCADDAKTVKSTTYVELRYSPHCETTWARVPSGVTGVLIDSLLIVSTSNGATRASSGARPVSSNWTVMLDDHNLLNYACVSYMFFDGDVEHTQCTASF